MESNTLLWPLETTCLRSRYHSNTLFRWNDMTRDLVSLDVVELLTKQQELVAGFGQ